jgi:hypothetical protein
MLALVGMQSSNDGGGGGGGGEGGAGGGGRRAARMAHAMRAPSCPWMIITRPLMS